MQLSSHSVYQHQSNKKTKGEPRIMRDTYVLTLFALFIASATFLAYQGKVEPQLIMTPIVTGFLGLLASTRPSRIPGSMFPPGSTKNAKDDN